MAPSSPHLEGENLDANGEELSQEEKMRLKVVKLAEKLNLAIARIWQVVACIAILPLIGSSISLIISIIHIAQGDTSLLVTTPLGKVGSLSEIASEYSISLVIFGLVSALILVLILIYIAAVLILRRKANLRVIFVALVLWLTVSISGSIIHRRDLFAERETETISHQTTEQIEPKKSAIE